DQFLDIDSKNFFARAIRIPNLLRHALTAVEGTVVELLAIDTKKWVNAALALSKRPKAVTPPCFLCRDALGSVASTTSSGAPRAGPNGATPPQATIAHGPGSSGAGDIVLVRRFRRAFRRRHAGHRHRGNQNRTALCHVGRVRHAVQRSSSRGRTLSIAR